MKKNTHAAVLSLLLPGLGQLEQGRPLVAMGLFAGFAVLLGYPATRPLLFPYVILCGLETYRRRAEAPVPVAARSYAYYTIAVAGAVGWIFLSLADFALR